MAQQITHIANCNVYLNGNSQLGKAEEVILPELTWIKSEHKALGQLGVAEFTSGIEAMECSIKWNSFYPDVLKKLSNPFTALSLQIRGSLEHHDSTGRLVEEKLVVYLKATPKTKKDGDFKAHEKVGVDSSFSVTSYKLEIGNVVIHDLDILANICMVDGIDLLATYRQNLGI
jgi:P2 family phage contractile tail tube protein